MKAMPKLEMMIRKIIIIMVRLEITTAIKAKTMLPCKQESMQL